jgi:hypothetical protein
MGEFTQNLLKLTEFPFSYSLFGLLALMFGQGIDPQKLSFAQIGPLLILMGFFATTLSICDPIGALQRWIIKGRRLPEFTEIGEDYFKTHIFTKELFEVFPPSYIFAIGFSPTTINKRYEKEKIDWDAVTYLDSEVRKFSRKKMTEEEFKKERKSLTKRKWQKWKQELRINLIIFTIVFIKNPLNFVAEAFSSVFLKAIPKEQVKEAEARAIASQLAKEKLAKEKLAKEKLAKEASRKKLAGFMDIFDSYGKELEKINKYDVQDIRNLYGALKQQTVKTKWITAEVDRITALFYFIIIISLFVYATQTQKELLPKFEHPFGDIKIAAFYVMIFSIVALIGVCVMLVIRIIGLQSKALTVFKYLTALRAVKTHKKQFETTLEDIERYLDDSHWTMAEDWVNRLEQDYSEVFLEEVKKPTSKEVKKPTSKEVKKPNSVSP